MKSMLLKADEIRYGYGGYPVLDGVSLELGSGEIVVLHGPSGCGKSTLLKVLLGIVEPQSGRIIRGNSGIEAAGQDFGYISQEDGLFPWFTLAQNLLLGGRVRAESKSAQNGTVERYLRDFGLGDLGHRYADQLSGGQRQRGALARALINRPKLLFADEPFRALDTMTRLGLLETLRREAKSAGLGVCMVSHDVDDSILIADRIVLLGHRPTKILGQFRVDLSEPRHNASIFSEEFQRQRVGYTQFCRFVGGDLLQESGK